MRFVIDTNIWLSYLINEQEDSLIAKLSEEDRVLIYSEDLLSEILNTALNLKFHQYFSTHRVERLIKALKESGYLIEDIPQLATFRDINDEFLLDLCHVSNADFLVTGDKALLELESYHQTQIITLTERSSFLGLKNNGRTGTYIRTGRGYYATATLGG